MIPVRIEGATRVLTAPAGWDKERDGPCGSLAIRDGGGMMTSAWQPTAEELMLLAGGASLYLTIVGNSHPPVSLVVGPPLFQRDS